MFFVRTFSACSLSTDVWNIWSTGLDWALPLLSKFTSILFSGRLPSIEMNLAIGVKVLPIF